MIARLKVESSEYDSKIQRAAKGIQHLAEACHNAGGQLNVLEDENREYIQSLGNMATVATTTRGKIAELTSAFIDIKSVYNSLSQEEKNGEVGKELNKQLDIMKGRIQEGKRELADINNEINGGGGLTGALDNLAGKFGMNIKQLAGWGTALTAAKGALDVAKDAFFNNEQQLDEWGRTVQASESLYQGFLNALNNTDISGFLTRMDDIVSAARDAYNAMDELGTFSAFNQRNVAKSRAGYSQALDEYKLNPNAENKQKLDQANQQVMNDLRDSHQKTEDAYQAALRQIATERLADKGLQDAFVNMFSNGNYDDLRTAKASYKSGTGLNAGAQYYYGDRVYDGRIQDRSTGNWRDMSASEKQQFEFACALSQLNDSQIKEVQALGAQSQAIIDQIYQQNRAYNRLAGNNAGTKGTSPQDQAAKAVADAQLAYEQAIKKAQMEFESGTISDADVKKKTLAAQESLWSAYGKAYKTYADPKYKEAQDAAAAEIVKLGGEVKASTEAQKAAQKATQEQEAAARKLAAAEEKRAEELDKLKDSAVSAVRNNDLKAAYQVQSKALQGGMSAGDVKIPATFTLTDNNLSALTNKLKEEISKAELGSELYKNLTTQLSDANTLGIFIQEAMKAGVDKAQLGEVGQSLWQKIFGEGIGEGIDIPQEVWQQIFGQLGGATGKDYQVGNDGSVTEKNGNSFNEIFKDFSSKLSSLGSGLNSVSSGLKNLGVTIPKEVDDVIGYIQAVSSVIQGVQTVISVFATSSQSLNTAAVSLNTTSVGLNTGMMAGLIAALEVNTASNFIPFAGGGIVPAFAHGGLIGKAAMGMMVPGNSFSGDNLRMPVDGGRGWIGVNSGELILNKSSQDNLALDIKNAESLIRTINNDSRLLGSTQQINLASQLTDSAMGGINLSSTISGEDIRLVLNNNGRRTGSGEYVQSRK